MLRVSTFFCRVNLKSDDDFAYMSYGVNCTEVEIDVLTGEVEVLRSDILFDCGQRYIPTYHSIRYSIHAVMLSVFRLYNR